MLCTMLLPYFRHGETEAGCDEAGRGCIAGPVFASAVILPEGFSHPELNDSKQLGPKTREKLRRIIEKEAIAFAVASVDAAEIDSTNILKASIKAMHKALEKLGIRPDFIIVDGNRFYPYRDIPYECVIKGDARFAPVAAASILAKTYRDSYMKEAAMKYPGYGWEKNFGYPTAGHRKAVAELGYTPLHRKTFRILPEPVLFPE